MARILVIDDDGDIRKMLRLMLEREGYEVVEATNGKEAIGLNRKEPADLVMTDIIMPERDGLETIRELRRDFPDTKIIAMSGGGYVGPTEYLNMAAKFGALSTFTKPFERGEILEAVRNLVDR